MIFFLHSTSGEQALELPQNDDPISFETSLLLDYSKNLRGGADTSGDATRHLFDFNLTFDLEELLSIEQSQFFLDFQTHEGQDGFPAVMRISPA